jgi:ribosomal protein S27E
MMALMSERFSDPKIELRELAGADIHVVCPRCEARAVVTTVHDARRVVCSGCGHTAQWPGRSSHWGGPVDPYFQLPLWLQADCRGKTLWAFNEVHLDLIEAYVAAGIRERGHGPPRMSLVSRLPAWIKFAKNRDDVLRTIRRIREAPHPVAPAAAARYRPTTII